MTTVAELRRRLDDVMLVDRDRLRRRIEGIARAREPAAVAIAAVASDLEAAAARLAARAAGVPALTYPPELPITARRTEIMAAIQAHQVVIVAGETGSGKTTQLPKMCLELGRGRAGLIGHTQPRRLAARSVADRIASELGTAPGTTVGSQIRFDARVSDLTLVKLMTDGILLAELAADRRLQRYDTLIVDEAHERSLNIDFILGYLHHLLPRRPDLRLVITSATIDPARFAQHFASADGQPAPVVEVSGRTYPVRIRYRPLMDEPGLSDEDEDYDAAASPAARAGVTGTRGAVLPRPAVVEAEPRDQVRAICEAIDELEAEPAGDVLVFLSGEREIRDTADELNRRQLAHTEIVPLYARLSIADQHRVFAPHIGRRIVLATNVAETSLTVPGIRYVIDPGTARISRYSHRLKVQRLPIEPVSQASADQRAGRCGRVADGVCIRLYTLADFEARARFTDPEILRTSLAAVILRMAALGLGEIESFPFIDPPDRRNIRDGTDLLRELGALEAGGPRLTPLGRRLAQLPIDPRLGRMVLEAERNGCVSEVLVIAAALSIQDPRERPSDAQQAAAAAHARFADPESDFLALLNLWTYLSQRQRALSSNQFRRMCRAEYLNYLRVREWQDLVAQLRQAVRGVAATGSAPGPASPAADRKRADRQPADRQRPGTTGPLDESESLAPQRDPAEVARIHTSLLAGLLSHVGTKDLTVKAGPANAPPAATRLAGRPARGQPEYLGARGARFAIVPGSSLFRRGPRWVMAAELVQTSRLWARVVARIEPSWLEPLAPHLVRRSYSEPHWSRAAAAVLAYEKLTLYGLPVVSRRAVNLGAIDPALSRELFIRHALIEGDWDTAHPFLDQNRELLKAAEELEERARRRGLVVDDHVLFDFYDQRLGAEVVSGRHFDTWWRRTRRQQPDLLRLTEEMLVGDATGLVSTSDYPDEWRHGELRLPLTYRFEPGSANDGVTVHLPLSVLDQVSAAGFDWQVPGLREDLIVALLRSLPKPLRRHVVPIPDQARALLAAVHPGQGSLLGALEAELSRMLSIEVRRTDWQLDKVPDHLRMTFRVVDADGSTRAEGKDLPALQAALVAQVRDELAGAAGGIEQTGLTSWNFGTLPQSLARAQAGYQVRMYPALTDEGTSVAIRVHGTAEAAADAMWRGTRRLLLLNLPDVATFVPNRLSNQAKLALSRNPYRDVRRLLDDCAAAALDALMAKAGGPAWDGAGFAALRAAVRPGLVDAVLAVLRDVQAVLEQWYPLDQHLSVPVGPAMLASYTDLRTQLADLVGPGFVTAAGAARLADLVRYLRAMARRLERLPANLARDVQLTHQIEVVQAEYRDLQVRFGADPAQRARLVEIRWMIQELRVNLFAQALGTAYPISDKRVYRAMDAVGSV